MKQAIMFVPKLVFALAVAAAALALGLGLGAYLAMTGGGGL